MESGDHMSDKRPAAGSLSVPGSPAIEGLSFRHFRGDEDYPAILEVNRASKVADGLEHDLHTLDSIKHAYSSTRNHDPLRDLLVVEAGGKVVAYIRVFWNRELDGSHVYWHSGFVVPEWRGRGIGRAMIRWAESHAREMWAGRDMEEGDGPAYISTVTFPTGLEKLLEAEGYEAVRFEFHMETPDLDHIPGARMPEGLEVRPAKPEHYRAIWAASNEAFHDHWGATEEGDDFDTWVNDPMNRPDLWMVAWEGDQVAGSILNYVNHAYNDLTGRKVGYTEWISVRRPWRKRGLARALLTRSMKMHKELGMTQTALGVDTQNPSGALRLYESMGYRVVSRSTTYRKPL